MGKGKTKKHMLELKAREDRSVCFVNGSVNAAFTIDDLHHNRLDKLTIVDDLNKSVNFIRDGNTREIETMLLAQAKTLDVFFNKMLRQTIGTSMINQVQAFSDIAFRAQNQCRKTLLALADIRHPKRTTFIKQQNNAVNQQVNNVLAENSKNPENPANELLEDLHHDEWLDRGTPLKAVTVNPEMETVDAVNRG